MTGKKIITYGIGFSLLFSSCGNQGQEGDKKEELKDTVSLAESNPVEEETGEVTCYMLPSPLQIATIYKKAGLKYYDGYTNNADNEKKYEDKSTADKALNMGIYVADLAYCVLNKQNDKSKGYLKSCAQLAEKLGFSRTYEENNIYKRLEKNTDNHDSVMNVLCQLQMQSDNLLEENKQEYLSVISFTGAWIESMYIGTKVHAKEKNAHVSALLTEQMGIAHNIRKALEANITKDAGIKGILADIRNIENTYSNFLAVKKITEEEDADIVDPAKINISEEELSAFSKKIEEVRTKIIQ